MELTAPDIDGILRKANRSLRHDVGRAYAGIVLGLLSSIALEALLHPDAWITLLAIYVVPVAFLALLLGHNGPTRGLFVARLAGATAGYLASWAVTGAFFSAIYQVGGSAMVLIGFPVVAALFVATGMTASNYLWVRMSRT